MRYLCAFLLLAAAQANAQEPFRLMSESMDRAMRRYLPEVDNPDLQEILDDPRLLIYTEREMPAAYQIWDGPFSGLHDPRFNITQVLGESDPTGNGNREFPWLKAAGTDRVKNLRAFRFLWLPRDDRGRPLPVVWYRKALAPAPPGERADRNLGVAWTFPWGAVVGELLAMPGPDGKDYTFELRTRTREIDAWGMDVFRPFPTATSLAERIKGLRPDWRDDAELVGFVRLMESDVGVRRASMADTAHAVRGFDQVAGQDELPQLDESLVRELLTGTKFRSALAETWREDWEGDAAFAPTTKARFHIVPANYDAGFVAVHRDSCIRCHETTNQTAALFDTSRDWWGRIRGSDGIFSFHPFEPSSISPDGQNRTPVIRASLLRAGFVAKFDPALHSGDDYRVLESLIPE